MSNEKRTFAPAPWRYALGSAAAQTPEGDFVGNRVLDADGVPVAVVRLEEGVDSLDANARVIEELPRLDSIS